jgi:hypothetical protein
LIEFIYLNFPISFLCESCEDKKSRNSREINSETLLLSTPKIFCGYLKKEGHIRRNWKLRYFILSADEYNKTSSLAYYVASRSVIPYGNKLKGSIDLKGFSNKFKLNLL